MPDSSLSVVEPAQVGEPVINRVAPDNGVTRLIFELREHGMVAIVVDVSLQGLPIANKVLHLCGACIVVLVDRLDDRLPGVQLVGVRQMMKEEDEIVGSVLWRFENLLDSRRILADVTGSGGNGAIHAHGVVIGANPLPPTIVLLRLGGRPVMRAGYVGESLEAEWARVMLVRRPRFHLDFGDLLEDSGIDRESLLSPLLRDGFGIQIGIPSQAAEAIKIRER